MTLIKLFKDKVSPKNSKSSRQRATDYIGIARNIVESYPEGLVHGLQKDAIQNGWDASLSHTKNHIKTKWSFSFILSKDKNGKYCLEMVDQETSGLTGDKVSSLDADDQSLAEDERWARWESLAFQKSKDAKTLGARGQGKMIFMWASAGYIMFYDSLRINGTYRFGTSLLTKTGSPVDHWDGPEAETEIKEKINFQPLTTTGSRVIIYDLKPKVVVAIKKGLLLKNIEETWWPNILKLGAKISVVDATAGHKPQLAKTPDLFKKLTNKPADNKNQKFWLKSNLTIKFKGESYKIKKLQIGYTKNKTIPENLRGISYFRGGMKINDLEVHIRQIRKYTYGYIEFDKKLDKLLYGLEKPNHYGFRETGENGTLWKKIKDKIEDEVEDFSKEKLGIGINVAKRINRQRNKAEKDALKNFNKYSRIWGIAGKRNQGLFKNLPTTDRSEESIKPVSLRLVNFEFPNRGLARLDIGQSINKFYIKIANKTANHYSAGIKIFILQGDRLIKTLLDDQLKLKPNSDLETKKISLAIDSQFSSGSYKLKINLFDQDSPSRQKLDELTRNFYVEKNPPQRLKTPFDLQGLHFNEKLSDRLDKDRFIDRQWSLEESTLYYNLDHPSYSKHSQNNQEARYLTEICLMAALQLVLKNIDSFTVKKKKVAPFNLDYLGSKKVDLFLEITRVFSKIKKDLDKS